MIEVPSRRIAVVLLNLGGPDSPEAVQPFLFNLFNDPAIMEVPGPLRWLLARMIARRRAAFARENYAKIGGASPLLANTQAQAAALQSAVATLGEVKVFIAMRYWHPLSEAVVRDVAQFAPDEIVLLPLYPQYSSTTSGSSMRRWQQAAASIGLSVPTRALCCYPTQAGFASASARLIEQGLVRALSSGRPRLLLSAHGLPKKIVARGDPYQVHVEQSAAAIIRVLKQRDARWQELEHVVCYQSRVGPLKWLGPYTDAEIKRAGADKRPIVLFPIAFVSEHSETLVELDIDYRHVAEAAGAPAYIRVPTVSTEPAFIEGLASMVRDALQQPARTTSDVGVRICPAACGRCAMAGMPA